MNTTSLENLALAKKSGQEPTSCSLPEMLQDILLPIVGFLGTLGNLWAGAILIRSNIKSNFHQSLKALIAVDILFLICMMVDSQKFEVNPENQIFIVMIPYFWNPFKNTVLTFQTFLIMSISAERYLAVKKPIQFNITKVKNSKRIHFLTFILPAFALAFTFNVPKFFETELVQIDKFNKDDNNTEEIYDYEITSLRMNPKYIFYYIHIARLLVMGILPFLALLVINILTLIKIKEGLKIRVSSLKAQKNQSKSRRQSITLMTIALVYLICNLPRVTLNLAEYLTQVDANSFCTTVRSMCLLTAQRAALKHISLSFTGHGETK